MRDTARAFWVTGPGRGEIQDVTLASPREHEILVRTRFSGISRGTEALVFAGRVPRSEWSRMRAPFQEGVFPAPVKYGYMNVGMVEVGPPRLRGRLIFALYPHQTHYVVPATAVHLLPDSLPPRRAVLAANMETAVNGLWDARPHVGDRVAVIGAGVVGCLVAWLASRVAGCRVQLVDVNPARAAVAAAIGVSFATPARAEGNCDLVVHASGSPDGLADALRLAGLEATVVEMSWFGDRTVPLQLGEAFHVNRLVLRSSQVGRIPAAQRARWDTARRMQFALDLLRDHQLDVLLTGESRFESLPDTMRRLTSGAEHPLCHVVAYD
jgi:D-arabinose 1-dehydrogenase-like Zn-dependent alcohol dehydrogenase